MKDKEPFAAESHHGFWLPVLSAFIVVVAILYGVLNHAGKKPQSPGEMVAAAFNRAGGVPGGNAAVTPGAGVNRPGANENMQWKTLFICPTDGAIENPVYTDAGDFPRCPRCGRRMVLNK